MDERFLRNEMLWGKDGQARLTAAHVIVFGLGGVGSYVAECLARAGVGELTLVDSDTVALSNLNRQLEALNSTVGLPKAEAVARRIRDINPYAVLHPMEALYNADNREQFFPAGCRYDYIVDAIDLVSCKLDLAETARRLGVPPYHGIGYRQQAGPLPAAAGGYFGDLRLPAGPGHAEGAAEPGHPPPDGGLFPEQPAPTQQLEAPPPGRRSVPASNPWVPATAGLLMGSKVVRDLIAQKEA